MPANIRRRQRTDRVKHSSLLRCRIFKAVKSFTVQGRGIYVIKGVSWFKASLLLTFVLQKCIKIATKMQLN